MASPDKLMAGDARIRSIGSPTTGPRRSPSWLAEVGRWSLGLRAAGIGLLIRLVTVAAIIATAVVEHRHLDHVFLRWDGNYYAAIATSGYPHPLPAGSRGVAASPAAFFPLFPWVTDALTVTGLPFWVAALVVVTICSTAAAGLIALVVRRYASDRVALITAACWSAFPLAGVLSTAYSEAMFTMLSAGCLLALLSERWLAAGMLGLLAGATRPIGIVLALACLVAAVAVIRRDRKFVGLASVVLAPLGALASWAWIGWRGGRWDAWSVTEADGWGTHVDGGVSTARSVWLAVGGRDAMDFSALRGELVVVLVLLVIIAAYRRPPAIVQTYLLAGTGVALASAGVYASIPRLLLPLFPLLVPVAALLDRCGTRVVVVALSLLTVLSVVIGAWYFTAAGFAP